MFFESLAECSLHSMVVHPKDRTRKEHQCGTIYNITCGIDSSHTDMGVNRWGTGGRAPHFSASGDSIGIVPKHFSVKKNCGGYTLTHHSPGT